MRKTKMMLLGVLLATAGASWTATAAGIDQYALKEFTADFTQFHIGDTVPAMYLTPEYNIKQWQQRNLPAPDAGGGDLAALRHPDARYPRGRSAEDPDPG
ncbi:RcnB family protein [Klebsiella pneumoniae]|uniref:RcnB family protein n=1 Tax=Klebsiella pneumoniae TaxID=573 RepID=UPI003B638E86